MPMRGWLQPYARDCAFPCAMGGLPRFGFGVVCGMAHRDVGDDAFSAVFVLGDHVIREPYAGLLLDGVHRNGERGHAVIQIAACSEGARFGGASGVPLWERRAWSPQSVAIGKISVESRALAQAEKLVWN